MRLSRETGEKREVLSTYNTCSITHSPSLTMVSSVSKHVLLLLAISLGLIFISSWRVHNIISNDYNLGERIIKSYTTNKTSCHGCHRSIRTNNDALFTKGEKKACTSTIQQWNVNENNFHNPNNNNDHRLDIDRSLAHFVSRKNSYGNKADFSALERECYTMHIQIKFGFIVL